MTSILAALAVGEISAVTVAFSHLLFNLLGIGVIWPIKFVREIPLRMANRMADISLASRVVPVLYIIVAFYLLPFLLIVLLR